MDARIATDDRGRQWWSMGHVPTDGPMINPKGSLMTLDPVEVTVGLSGVQSTTHPAVGTATSAPR